MRFHKIGTSDFDLKREIIFKENYFTMLEKSFAGLKNYEKLVKKLKQLSPSRFYDFLTEISDKYNDIQYMYEQKYNETFFNTYVKDILLELQADEELEDIEDIDFEEGD